MTLFCHLEFLSPSIAMPRSYFGPLEDHSSPRESSLPLSACASICSWILATLDAITCDPMLRSHRMIVQTFDNVTPVASVTLMYLLYHAACTDGSTAVVLCSTLQRARDRPPSRVGRPSRSPVPRFTGSPLSLVTPNMTDRCYTFLYSPSSPSTIHTANCLQH